MSIQRNWIVLISLICLQVILFSNVFTQTGSWVFQNPAIPRNSLTSVFFVNHETGWVVGSNGLIMKTSNGGKNWNLRTSGTSYYLSSVNFIDETTGWAVGDYRIILKTVDGGASWQRLDDGFDLLKSVFFIDSQTGWVAGSTMTGPGIILKTQDGGLTWRKQSTSAKYGHSAIQFVDSNFGCVVGSIGEIFTTTDGGNKWDVQTSNTTKPLRAVYFIDRETGWATGWDGLIIKTIDGGKIWIAQVSGTTEDLHSIYFVDELNGWAVGGDSNNEIILKTTDGGISWTPQSVNSDGRLLSIKFFDQSVGWAVGSNGKILTTTDSGTTWENQQSSITSEDLYGVFFHDNQIGWAGGANGFLTKTIDAGDNWNQVFIQNQSINNSIIFTDLDNGWIGSYGKVLHTKNNGDSWIQNNIPEQKAIQDMFFLDSKTGWIVGCGSQSRRIFKTIDGGITWKTQLSSGELALLDVFFINNIKGWAVGLNGSILSTIDSGTNWIKQNSGVTNSLESVYFLNEKKGFAVGYNIILQSIDGGVTWYKTTKSYSWLDDVFFIDQLHGWAVGIRGTGLSKTTAVDGTVTRSHTQSNESTIWSTTDGGATWSSLRIPSNSWLLEVFFADLNNGWAVGEDGTILKYTNTVPIPSPPSNLAVNILSEIDVHLTWSDNSDNEDGFRIYRSDGVSSAYTLIDSVEANVTYYSDLNLSNNSSFWYRLDAFNSFGNSAKSLEASITVKLNTPSNLTATLISDSQINLNWQDNSSREAGYRIERKKGMEESYSILDSVDANITYYSDFEISEGMTYYYRVQAYSSSVSSDYSNEVNVTTPPSRPTLISPNNGAVNQSTTVVLIWNPANGATTYHLQVSTNQAFTNLVFEDSTITSTSKEVGPLANYTTYYWRVNASHLDSTSPWSYIWNFTTIIAAPSVPILTSPDDGSTNQPTTLTFGWNPSSNAATYRLQVSTDTDFISTVFEDSTITSTSQQFGPLINNTTYYWRVRAKNIGGTSPWSSPTWNFTTIIHLPNQVSLISPLHSEVISSDTVCFIWRQSKPAVIRYWFEISTDSLMTNPLVDSSLSDTTIMMDELIKNQTYWWRVKAKNIAGWGIFSKKRNFRIIETGVKITDEIPTKFSLSYNYPNPFNPETTIKYQLPKASAVTLEIYDILGTKIISLINQQQPAGLHTVKWNGKNDTEQNVASGIYLYRLQAGEFVQVRKMMLLR